MNTQRGTGRTTNQLKALPEGGVFIWLHGDLFYPKQLCYFLKREDIKVVSPEWVMGDSWLGQEFTGVDVDHAFSLFYTAQFRCEFYERLDILKTRIRA